MIEFGSTAAYQLSHTNHLLIIHCTCRRKGKLRKGYYYVRRWLRDPNDIATGWEIDRWFRWRSRR